MADRTRFAMIMTDGRLYKDPRGHARAMGAMAAE
jgi:hypothetical protein